ncbi:MAG: iron-sulfur cluster repair di-iron protein, partial [Bacteroidota bacterium]
MSVLERKIGSVVEENFVYARALHHLGIDFFLDEHRSLQEVCLEKGISKQQVIKCFYQFDNASKSSFSELLVYPMDLLLEYLKHSHHLFIKEKLPYISYLINHHESEELQDLKVVFPEFVEDFIRHIYEEEDELFDYLSYLQKLANNKVKNPAIKFMNEERVSLKSLQYEHDNEDEMANMRDLIE